MSDVDMFEDEEDHAEYLENLEDDTVTETPLSKKGQEDGQQEKTKEPYKVIIDGDHRYRIKLREGGNIYNNGPYVYHNLEEVLKYTFDCFPKNNKIHLVGVHVFFPDKGHYLQKHSNDKVSIPLDFTIADSVPNKNELVSVYGFLEIKKSTLIFVVNFFRRESKILVNDYIKNLLEGRKYVPIEYVATMSIDTIK